MQLIINGETRNFEESKTLQEIMLVLGIEEKVMAAAVNMQIVKKEQWQKFSPNEGDKIELLHFVGGG